MSQRSCRKGPPKSACQTQTSVGFGEEGKERKGMSVGRWVGRVKRKNKEARGELGRSDAKQKTSVMEHLLCARFFL